MDINTCFPSKYVGHTDLRGQEVPVSISRVGLENVSGDDERNGQGKNQKPVVYFSGMSKGLILNKTNAGRIAEMYGPETDNWIGRTIVLYTAETEYGGKPVQCVRVRQASAAQPAAAMPPQPAAAPPVEPLAAAPADAPMAPLKF